MPRRMVMQLPIAIDFWLNYWCSSGGVSRTIPPTEIMTGIKLDANKHCRFQFGDYVLAHEETDDTMKPRATDCFYLHLTGTPDRAFMVMNLVTGEKVRRYSATVAHMNKSIISWVEEIAESEGMPQGVSTDTNDITIYDIKTESVATIDNDNASNESYRPEDGDSDQSDKEWEAQTNMDIDESFDPSEELRIVQNADIMDLQRKKCSEGNLPEMEWTSTVTQERGECEQQKSQEWSNQNAHTSRDHDMVDCDDEEEVMVFEGADEGKDGIDITHPNIGEDGTKMWTQQARRSKEISVKLTMRITQTAQT